MLTEKLSEIREKTGMNKKEFASYIGLKYTTYNGYETGAREPGTDFLKLISQKFDISIDYLLGLQSNKNILHSYQLRSVEYEHIEKYRQLDSHGSEIVDYVLEKEYERCISQSEGKLHAFPSDNKNHLIPNAAHADENNHPTPDALRLEDDMMSDDNRWK